jgi:hypothetical protein
LTWLKKQGSNDFVMSMIDLSRNAIPDDVDAVLVAGPTEAFDDKGLREIDRFLQRGKGGVFLVPGMKVLSPRGKKGAARFETLMPNETKLEQLLLPYGFKIEASVVAEKSPALGLVRFADKKVLAPRPFFVPVAAENASAPSFFCDVPSLTFPYASPVQWIGSSERGRPLKIWKLATSSANSWTVAGKQTMDPDLSARLVPPEKTEPQVLAYAYRGAAKPAFPEPATAVAPAPASVRLVVIGSALFASDSFVELNLALPFYSGDAQFLLNAMNWLFEDDAIASLRPKQSSCGPGFAEDAVDPSARR